MTTTTDTRTTVTELVVLIQQYFDEQYVVTEQYCNSLIEMNNNCIQRRRQSTNSNVDNNDNNETHPDNVFETYESNYFSNQQQISSDDDNLTLTIVATIERHHEITMKLHKCKEQIETTIEKIRNLSSLNDANTTVLIVIMDHVNRCQRIYNTIKRNGIRFHSNGVPMIMQNSEDNDMDVQSVYMVCLATLRASIEKLKSSS